MNNRNDLAERMELVGELFEIDGMEELVKKYEKGMKIVKFNAVTIQISSLLLRENKRLADRIIALGEGITQEEVDELDDATYANKLKTLIVTDVMGFFASSPSSDGGK